MSDIKKLLPSFYDELERIGQEEIEKRAGLKQVGQKIVGAVKAVPGAVSKGYHAANAKVLSGMAHLATKHPGLYDAMMDPDNAASVAQTITNHLK